MEVTRPYVVFCEVHEDNTTVISFRLNNRWLYAECHKEGLGYGEPAKYYDKLIQAYWRQQRDEEASDPKESEKVLSKSGKDSGYSSGKEDNTSQQEEKAEEIEELSDALQSLQDWLLQALAPVVKEICDLEQNSKQFSLSDWYNVPSYCYNLKVHESDTSRLIAETDEDIDGEHMVQESLIPRIEIPKYLRNLKEILWYNPDVLVVQSEADDIHMPIHPTIVSVDTANSPAKAPDTVPTKTKQRTDVEATTSDTTSKKSSSNHESKPAYFLKLATAPDAVSIKRELRVLNELRKKNLYSKGLRAPQLAGLVKLPSSSSKSTTRPSHILGFLLTLIPQPTTPLTHLMTSSASSEKRSAYAKEAEKMINILHDGGLVWGDSKADNFLVDAEEKLWMIDFGGSYTPGWVDKEVADTVEGDEMGVEKIVGGLEDPERNMEGGEEEGESEEKERKQVEVLRERGLATKSRDRSVHMVVKKKRRRDNKRSDEKEDDKGKDLREDRKKRRSR